MSEIWVTKIDGQEFVPYKDYLRLKEIAHDELKELKETAETVKELEQENGKLKKEKEELEYLGDINEELKMENKKLRAEKSDYEVDEKDEIIDHLKYDLDRTNQDLATYQKKK